MQSNTTPLLHVGSDVHLSSQNKFDLSVGKMTLMQVNQLRSLGEMTLVM